MSQLHALLQTLDERELSILQSQRLIGKEKEIFDYILAHAAGDLPDSDTILRKLSVTDTHYYKINSVLLRKCYQQLVPAEGLALLQFLKTKNLFHLLRHEALFQDKKHLKSAKGADLASFYLACFHYFIDFPYKFYDKKLTELFGEKYLNSIKDCSPSDRLYVKYHKLFSDVNRMAARKNPQKALGLTSADLLANEKELSGTSHHLAAYYLYRSFCSYHTYYEKDNGKVLEYLQKAMALQEKIAYFFPIDIGRFLSLLYADALFQADNIKEAGQIYTKAFQEGVNSDMYGYYYHCEQFILVSIIQQNYDKALALLNKVFKPCIDNKLDIYATRGAMCYVKLYLSKGDLKQASVYLNAAKAINEKTFYLPFDVQLRVLENICFFLKKDYEFSLQLANRNLKFLRSQEKARALHDYLLLWKMIIGLLNCIYKREKVNAAILKDHAFLSRQYRNLYCDLIPKLLEQTQEEIS